MPNYRRLLLALTDEELEQFIADWLQAKKKHYVEIVRFSGPSDMGRDAVGFLTTKRHEGPWHNYQCKQYRNTLPTNVAITEIGKILYFAFKGHFSPPVEYAFVTPRGVNRNLEKLIYNPTLFKDRVIQDWDQYCNGSIVAGTSIQLSADLKQYISAYDFSKIRRSTVDDILSDADITPALVKWFGMDPGPPPGGVVPADVQSAELNYIRKLLHAYSKRENTPIETTEELLIWKNHHRNLQNQRVRFYDADAFKRFYRDNTDPLHIQTVEKDIYHAVVDLCDSIKGDPLDVVNAVMSQAARTQVSGLLAQHAQVSVKQGMCHHLANEDKLDWSTRE